MAFLGGGVLEEQAASWPPVICGPDEEKSFDSRENPLRHHVIAPSVARDVMCPRLRDVAASSKV